MSEAEEPNLDLRYLGDLQRLTVGPNDLLFITFPGRVTSEQAHQLRQHLESKMPRGLGVIVIGDGAKLGVVDITEFINKNA